MSGHRTWHRSSRRGGSGGVGHALGTGSDNDISVASDDGLRTDDDRLDRGGANLVDGGGNGRLGETSTNGALAGRVLAEATTCQNIGTNRCDISLLGGEDIANKDFFNVFGLQASTVNGGCACVRQLIASMWETFQQTLDRMRAKLNSTQTREGAILVVS